MPSIRRTIRASLSASLFAAALLGAHGASAATLRGRVIDRETFRPVEGAAVRVSEAGRVQFTGPDGSFVFLALPAGRWTLSAHHLAYAGAEHAVTLAEAGDSVTIALRTAIHPADEVIVESARSAFSLRRGPWAAGARSAEQLAGQDAVTPSEKAAELPGVSLVRDGSWQTAVSIRGMGRSNVVALVDHTRLETANDLAGALSLVNAADLERIEVMKSPGSVLFGSGALGGAIQMITRRAPFADAARWSGEWTEGLTASGAGESHALSAERSAERTALRVSAAYRDAGNTSTPRGDIPNSQYTDFNLGASLGVRTRGEQSLFASWQRSQAENTGIPGGSPFSSTATATYRLAMRERFALEYLLPNVAPGLPLVSVRVSHQGIARNVEILQSPTVTVTPHATHATSSAQVESRLLPAANHVLTVGAEAWQRRLDSRRERVLAATNRTVGERPVPKSSNASAGLYAQDDWTVAHDRLRVVLGARHDWSRTSNDATFNPDYVIIGGIRQEPTPGQTLLWSGQNTRDQSWDASAGLHAQLASAVSARLLVATAFRSPSLEERFQYLDLGGVLHVGDPHLRPERSRSVNLGARVEGRSLTLDADLFLNSLTDLVTETAGTFQGRSAFVKTNVGEARLYGFELSAEQRLGARHAVTVSFASVRGEDTGRHVELPQIAPLAASAEWNTDVSRAGTLRLGVSAAHAQDRPAPDEARTAGWTTWRASWASVPWRAGGATFRVRAGCDNLFDRAYRRHLSTLRGLVRLEPGRGAWVNVTTSFGGVR